MLPCLGGGGHHARLLLRRPRDCRTPVVEAVPSHTLAVVLAWCVVSICDATASEASEALQNVSNFEVEAHVLLLANEPVRGY